MDVIGAGFGRTGTLSMKVALEMLGFGPCAHMIPLIGDEERSTLFTRAALGDDASLDKALDGCRSTVDWPGVFFWRDLVAKYPDAKVVLTVRDPEKWYASAEKTIWAATNQPTPPHMRAFREMCDATNWEGTFHGRFGEKDYAIKIFNEHNDAVRSEIPAGRLLEYEVGEGWSRLCDFLEVPEPAQEFPRLNDAASFQDRIMKTVAQA
jgi:Sulfotransferase domain